MTSNQIAFMQLLSNREINLGNLRETARHNAIMEGIEQYRINQKDRELRQDLVKFNLNLEETIRKNTMENAYRSNVIAVNRADLVERTRHNMVSEQIQSDTLDWNKQYQAGSLQLQERSINNNLAIETQKIAQSRYATDVNAQLQRESIAQQKNQAALNYRLGLKNIALGYANAEIAQQNANTNAVNALTNQQNADTQSRNATTNWTRVLNDYQIDLQRLGLQEEQNAHTNAKVDMETAAIPWSNFWRGYEANTRLIDAILPF